MKIMTEKIILLGYNKNMEILFMTEGEFDLVDKKDIELILEDINNMTESDYKIYLKFCYGIFNRLRFKYYIVMDTTEIESLFNFVLMKYKMYFKPDKNMKKSSFLYMLLNQELIKNNTKATKIQNNEVLGTEDDWYSEMRRSD